MTIRVAVAGRNAALNAELDRADAGAGPAVIEVYTGTQPADGDAVETGTLLLTFTCAAVAWFPAVDGVKTLDADPDLTATAVATGTAGWARQKDSNGVDVFDGSCGVTGADFILNTTSVTLGESVNLLAGTVTYPA